MSNIVYPCKRVSFTIRNNVLNIIYDPNGNFILKTYHDEIINNIHQSFSLLGMSYNSPKCYRPVISEKNSIIYLSCPDENICDESNYPFIKFSDHDKIIGLIERKIFV